MDARTSFEPRVPLVLAEEVVGYVALRDHVTEARRRTEQMLIPTAIRYAASLDLNYGIPSYTAAQALERALHRAISATMIFGYRTVVAELQELRARKGTRERPVVEDFGRMPEIAGPALQAITAHARQRFIDRMQREYRRIEPDDPGRGDKLRTQALQSAHVIAVEFVSRALNAGRSLGALGERPMVVTAAVAALYAMRSEQLDANTCEPCDSLHGEISDVNTTRYYLLMPPNGCVTASIPLIGPRCRGIYVYGDSLGDFLQA